MTLRPTLLEKVIMQSGHGQVVLDRDRRVLFWNHWLENASGVNANEAKGRTLEEVFDIVLPPRLSQAIDKALQFGQSSLLSRAFTPHPLPLKHAFNPGQLMYQKQIIKGISDEAGSRVCLLDIVDVSQSVTREQKLQEQSRDLEKALNRVSETEQRFRALFERSPDCILVIDQARLTIAEHNDMALNLLGYRREELYQKSVLEVFKAEDKDVREFLEKVTREASGWTDSLPCLNKKGQVLPAEISASSLEIDGERHLIAQVRDTRERTRAREKLKESERHYRGLFEDSPISLWEEDFTKVKAYFDQLKAQGVEDLRAFFETKPDEVQKCLELPIIRDVNQATVRLFQSNDKATLLSRLSRIFTGESLNIFKDQLLSFFEGRTVFESEGAVFSLAGERMFIKFKSSVMPGFEQNLARVIVSILDITRQKQTELDLAKKAVALEHSNEELEQFAFAASHDLNEPLRKIMAFGDLLVEECGGQINEEGLGYIRVMQNAASRMQNLISSLLSLSRVTTRANPFMAVNLNTTVQDVISDLQVQIRESDAVIHVGELPVIEGDPSQMQRLFQNLIGNALKYRREGVSPELWIGAAPEQDSSSEHLPNGSPEMWRISIRDNGIGFKEKHVERIFQIFQRLHTRQKYEGTGIGLAICRKIVTRHHGSISATSVPDEGSTFILRFPARQKE